MNAQTTVDRPTLGDEKQQMRMIISVLGGFRVEGHDGVTVKIPSKKTRALLAYLLVEHKAVHARDKLMTLFWPDASKKSAQNSLRVNLYRLRAALNEADSALGRAFIVHNRQHVALNLSGVAGQVFIDTVEFERLIAAVKSHDHRDALHCMQCHQKLQRAARLYKGDLLVGFSAELNDPLDVWLATRREWYNTQAVWTFRRLIAMERTHNQWERMLDAARKLTVIDPWSEFAHQHVMLGLAKLGDRNGALAQYATLKSLLQTELAVDPEPDTTALFEQIHDRRLVVVEQPQSASAQQTTAPAHNFPHSVNRFVGRDVVYQTLESLRSDKHVRLITVVGAGGVGKTRLVTEWGRQIYTAYRDGALFVDLTDVEHASSAQAEAALLTKLAQALQLSADYGSVSITAIIEALRSQQRLLVLDNVEGLVEAAQLVDQLLRNTPDLTIVCTSREALNLRAEWLVPLKGLSLPPQGEENVEAYASVALFIERTNQLDQSLALNAEDMANVAAICRLVGGTPLAIELASAAMRFHTPAAIRKMLLQSLAILSTRRRDIPLRQRSMEAVMNSTWQRLLPREQRILTQLSMFEEPFSPKEAMTKTEAHMRDLEQLANRSLLEVDRHSGRFHLSYVTRRYAASRNHTHKKP